jgi:phosphoserine phosphatase RsbX
MMPAVIAQRSFKDSPHCGDRGACWEQDDVAVMAMIDGLGHGETAEIAALAAMEYVSEHLDETIEEILFGCNKAIAGTIGVAMSITMLDKLNGVASFAGVGNTTAKVVSRQNWRSFSMASDPGIVGERIRSLFTENVEYLPDYLLLMYTDGISPMIDIGKYDAEHRADLGTWAEMLVEDWGSKNDDRTLMIYTWDGKATAKG